MIHHSNHVPWHLPRQHIFISSALEISIRRGAGLILVVEVVTSKRSARARHRVADLEAVKLILVALLAALVQKNTNENTKQSKCCCDATNDNADLCGIRKAYG